MQTGEHDGVVMTSLKPASAPAAAYAIRVLQVLKAAAPEQLGVSEIGRRVGVGKATTHRIVMTLVEEACLVQNPINKAFSLGPALISLGEAAAGDGNLLSAAKAALKELAAQTGLTASVFRLLPDARLVAVASVRGPGDFPIRLPFGEAIFPLTAITGLAEIAWASARQADQLRSATLARGLAAYDEDREAFVEDVRFARDHGYTWGVVLGGNPKIQGKEVLRWLNEAAALGIGRKSQKARDFQLSQIERLAQEYDPENKRPAPLFGIAVPVFDDNGLVVLQVAVYAFLSQVPPSAVPRLANDVISAARQIMSQIGGRAPRPDEIAQL
jgi:DNA-binding IclR family transcriptional regulator